MSDLSQSDEHGGVTDEMMEEFFSTHPGLRPTSQTPEPEPQQEPSTTPPVEAPPEGEPEAAPDTATPEPPPEPSDDFLELDGVRYPRSQINAAAQFQTQLARDPQLQRLITDYLTGASIGQQPQQVTPQQTPSIPAESVQPPAGLDLEDPQIRALYNVVQEQQRQISEQINQLSQGLRVTHDQTVASQRQQIDAQWNVASQAFAKDHNLEAEDVDRLGQVAARLGVLPQLMQGIDPITGSPSSPDPIRAFQRALEIAMFQVPEYREREFRRSVTSMQEESQKRKLLGAVGGSSGSVARTTTPPKPGSNEARKAMLAEVGAMLEGNWSDPTAN